MININQPATPISIPSFLGQRIAFGTSIDANTLGTTNLTWDNGCNLSNSIPMFFIIKYKTGTYTLAATVLKIGSITLSASMALNGLSANAICIAPILTSGLIIDSTQSNISITIGTINGSSAAFDVEIFGFKY